jgi:hypothetical protein
MINDGMGKARPWGHCDRQNRDKIILKISKKDLDMRNMQSKNLFSPTSKGAGRVKAVRACASSSNERRSFMRAEDSPPGHSSPLTAGASKAVSLSVGQRAV